MELALGAAFRTAGLREMEVKGGLRPRVLGSKGPMQVELRPYAGTNGERTGTTIRVELVGLHGSALSSVSITREGFNSRISRASGEREVMIGDPEFDAAVFIQGPVGVVRALLDEKTRYVLWRMIVKDSIEIPARRVYVEAKVTLWAGVLQATVADGEGRGQLAELPWIIEALLEAMARLMRPEDIGARLAEIVRGDRERGVRLECLLMLIRDYPDHAETPAALRAGIEDRYDEIRLRSAMGLGEEGRPTLLALAAGDRAGDDCSARAVAALGEHLPVERAQEILGSAVPARRTATACACLAALGRWGGAAGFASLVRMRPAGNVAMAAAAAQALGDTWSPEAESPLVKALGHAETEVRVAAAVGLGQVGTVSAVVALREVEERARRDERLRRAARQSIAAIQARAGGASPGQLSVAVGEIGQLSLPAGEEGNLSLTPVTKQPGSADPRTC